MRSAPDPVLTLPDEGAGLALLGCALAALAASPLIAGLWWLA